MKYSIKPAIKTGRKLLCLLPLFFLATTVRAEPVSGYAFITPETRAMQDDDFANPGLLAVDRGLELFQQKDKGSTKSCVSCHGDDGEKLDRKAIAAYPKFNAAGKQISQQIISLQDQINTCRVRNGNTRMATNSHDLVTLETFVRSLARGEKQNVETGKAVASILAKGEKLYKTRYGLIDMSCNHCHNLYTGKMIRGQKISQGQGNGFPVYRLDTGEITSLQQRIQQCMNLLRAEPFPTDSDEIKLLEYYIMSRGNGLPIETPAVRY